MSAPISPHDHAIAQYVAEARREASTLPGQLACLRRVALGEAALLEKRSARRILVVAGHAAWLVLHVHGVGDPEATLRAGKFVRELRTAVSKAQAP